MRRNKEQIETSVSSRRYATMFQEKEPAELHRSSWWEKSPAIRSERNKKADHKGMVERDYGVSRQKQLSVVFVVANAQKQGANRDECIESKICDYVSRERTRRAS